MREVRLYGEGDKSIVSTTDTSLNNGATDVGWHDVGADQR